MMRRFYLATPASGAVAAALLALRPLPPDAIARSKATGHRDVAVTRKAPARRRPASAKSNRQRPSGRDSPEKGGAMDARGDSGSDPAGPLLYVPRPATSLTNVNYNINAVIKALKERKKDRPPTRRGAKAPMVVSKSRGATADATPEGGPAAAPDKGYSRKGPRRNGRASSGQLSGQALHSLPSAATVETNKGSIIKDNQNSSGWLPGQKSGAKSQRAGNRKKGPRSAPLRPEQGDKGQDVLSGPTSTAGRSGKTKSVKKTTERKAIQDRREKGENGAEAHSEASDRGHIMRQWKDDAMGCYDDADLGHTLTRLSRVVDRIQRDKSRDPFIRALKDDITQILPLDVANWSQSESAASAYPSLGNPATKGSGESHASTDGCSHLSTPYGQCPDGGDQHESEQLLSNDHEVWGGNGQQPEPAALHPEQPVPASPQEAHETNSFSSCRQLAPPHESDLPSIDGCHQPANAQPYLQSGGAIAPIAGAGSAGVGSAHDGGSEEPTVQSTCDPEQRPRAWKAQNPRTISDDSIFETPLPFLPPTPPPGASPPVDDPPPATADTALHSGSGHSGSSAGAATSSAAASTALTLVQDYYPPAVISRADLAKACLAVLATFMFF